MVADLALASLCAGRQQSWGQEGHLLLSLLLTCWCSSEPPRQGSASTALGNALVVCSYCGQLLLTHRFWHILSQSHVFQCGWFCLYEHFWELYCTPGLWIAFLMLTTENFCLSPEPVISERTMCFYHSFQPFLPCSMPLYVTYLAWPLRDLGKKGGH